MAVMGCPEKAAPRALGGASSTRGLGGSAIVSEKERLAGLRRGAPGPSRGTRTALYLRVPTADRKPDLRYDGLRGYAERAGLDVVQDYYDVAVSGRREGRPRLNALMAAARRRERAGDNVAPVAPSRGPPAPAGAVAPRRGRRHSPRRGRPLPAGPGGGPARASAAGRADRGSARHARRTPRAAR